MGRGWYSDYLWGDLDRLFYIYESAMEADSLNEEAEPKVPHAQNYFRFLGPPSYRDSR